MITYFTPMCLKSRGEAWRGGREEAGEMAQWLRVLAALEWTHVRFPPAPIVRSSQLPLTLAPEEYKSLF